MKTILTQLATITALSMAYLAYTWITDGYGLNPFISLPLATLLLILPYPVTKRGAN